MYAKGMTTRDIQAQIKGFYNYDISPDTVSSTTDKVIERAREWQSRPLERIYAVIYMDAVFLKMKSEGYCGTWLFIPSSALTWMDRRNVWGCGSVRRNHRVTLRLFP
jgi:transposase-like protein